MKSDCEKLKEFLRGQGNTDAEIAAAGIQGTQVQSLTLDLSSAARVARGGKKKAAKGGKKKTAKGGKKASRGGKKTAKGGRKNR